MTALALGYIRNPRADFIFFIALPFAAIAIGLGFHHWLPFIAQASIAVWITVPHHYAGWIRAYGLPTDWTRWRSRLVIGPLLIIPSLMIGTAFTPVTLGVVLMLWDHQHSIMQQHGFARVYDFKAGTGAPSTPRFDLWLGVVLFSNLLVVGPIWSELWVAQLFNWNLPVHAATVQHVHAISWTVTGIYAAVYLGHVAWSIARGYRINPMKYLMIASSYTLWYFVSWQDSYLLYAVAHRIMHGVQYMAMVYWYVGQKRDRTGEIPRLLGNAGVGRFLLLGVVYAVIFQIAIGGGLGEMSFGLISVLQADEFLHWGPEKAAGFYAATAVNAAAACHYYVDSFIWKVSDARTQQGL